MHITRSGVVVVWHMAGDPSCSGCCRCYNLYSLCECVPSHTREGIFFHLPFVFIGPVNLTICPIGKCQFSVLANEHVGRLWCEMTQSGGEKRSASFHPVKVSGGNTWAKVATLQNTNTSCIRIFNQQTSPCLSERISCHTQTETLK